MLVYDYVLMKGTAFSRKVLSLAHKNNSLFIGDSAYGMECNTYEFEQAILSIDGDQLKHLVDLCQEKSFRMPSGLSREERREWARNNNNPLNSIQLKEKQMSNVDYDHGLDKLVREWIFLLGEFKSPSKTGKELNDSLNLGADIFEPDIEYFIEESDRRGDDNVCSITLNQKQYSIYPKGE